MSHTFSFTLAVRPTVPAVYPAVGADLSRHHVLGQKYLQVLLALARDTGVAERTLERFAGRPLRDSSDWDAVMPNAFVWSPFALFVGPEGTLRVFDPSSGVEQQRPHSFPEPRWTALRAVPRYLEEIGVPLAQLVRLDVGGSVRWTLRPDRTELARGLTERIKAVSDTSGADHVPVHDLRTADWAWVRETDVRNFRPRDADDVADIYATFHEQIDRTRTFEEALASRAFRFLLVP